MRTWEKLSIMALLWGMSCIGCARQSLVPIVERANTRWIAGFTMDSAVVRIASDIFQAGLPNEQALCLRGHLVPAIEHDRYSLIVVDAVAKAAWDSVDQYHVFFGNPQSGCRWPMVGIAHDHTTVPIMAPCTHSDPDAWLAASDTRVLMSLVFCPGGRGEVLFADGRRGVFTWGTP